MISLDLPERDIKGICAPNLSQVNVSGSNSWIVGRDPGAMAGYIDGLLRLRALAPAFICPGHGPLVRDADAKLAGYIAHRLARERQLLAALDAGLRTVDELLDAVWAGTPEPLRLAATATLAAHLDKLADEGRLPAGVQRPPFNGWPP